MERAVPHLTRTNVRWLFDNGASSSGSHTQDEPFLITLGSPFGFSVSAAISPPAALWEKPWKAYSLFLNGLHHYMSGKNTCQETNVHKMSTKMERGFDNFLLGPRMQPTIYKWGNRGNRRLHQPLEYIWNLTTILHHLGFGLYTELLWCGCNLKSIKK